MTRILLAALALLCVAGFVLLGAGLFPHGLLSFLVVRVVIGSLTVLAIWRIARDLRAMD
jgi:hypothetical protein